jgi:ABC-2 type transport system ATP-binding protein
VFLSTHSLDIAEQLADRIGIVQKGRLVGCGPLASLRQQAASDGSLEDVFLRLTADDDLDGLGPAPEGEIRRPPAEGLTTLDHLTTRPRDPRELRP